jgi:uncharacterized membrane protein
MSQPEVTVQNQGREGLDSSRIVYHATVIKDPRKRGYGLSERVPYREDDDSAVNVAVNLGMQTNAVLAAVEAAKETQKPTTIEFKVLQ